MDSIHHIIQSIVLFNDTMIPIHHFNLWTTFLSLQYHSLYSIWMVIVTEENRSINRESIQQTTCQIEMMDFAFYTLLSYSLLRIWPFQQYSLLWVRLLQNKINFHIIDIFWRTYIHYRLNRAAILTGESKGDQNA